MRLHSFVNEIFDIAAANNVDVGVGESMFMRNVHDGKESYKGAHGVDYAKLQPYYDSMRVSAYSYRRCVGQHLQKIVKLRNAGKRAEAKAFVESH